MKNSQDKDLLLLKYGVLSDRRRHFDSLFWQIPALSLGGQAFLLSIALDSGSRGAARLLSALLGIFIAFVSLASLSRIRLYEFTITKMLIKTEEEIFGNSFSDTNSKEWIAANQEAAGKTTDSKVPVRKGIYKKVMFKVFSFLHPVRSYDVWVLTQVLFIIVGCLIIGVSLARNPIFISLDNL